MDWSIHLQFWFYPKWFEPSRPFGFLHLPMSGLSATGQPAEMLEGRQEKETTWHFMVVLSWNSLEESFCRHDSSCHVRSLWVIVPHLPNYLLPLQTSLLITSSSLPFSSSSRHRTGSAVTVWTLLLNEWQVGNTKKQHCRGFYITVGRNSMHHLNNIPHRKQFMATEFEFSMLQSQ